MTLFTRPQAVEKVEQIYEALVDSLNNCEAFIEEEDGDDDEMMGMDEDEEDENSTNWLDGALAVKHKSEDDLVGRKIRINWGEEDGGWAVGVVTSYEGKGLYLIKYNEGEEAKEKLAKEKWELWVDDEDDGEEGGDEDSDSDGNEDSGSDEDSDSD
jgi:hypothetical protein